MNKRRTLVALVLSLTFTGAALAQAGSAAKQLSQLWAGATRAEAECVVATLQSKGYPVASTPSCLGMTTADQCAKCVALLKVSDDDSYLVKGKCLPGSDGKKAAGATAETGGSTVRVQSGDGSVEVTDGTVTLRGGDSTVKVDGNGVSGTSSTGDSVTVTGAGGSTTIETKTEGGSTVSTGGSKTSVAPINCDGVQVINLSGRLIKSDDVAVRGAGTCVINLTDCEIVGGKRGIDVAGTSIVNLTNCKVQGGISIAGMGKVNSQKSTIKGGVQREGLATFVDSGGNTIQ